MKKVYYTNKYTVTIPLEYNEQGYVVSTGTAGDTYVYEVLK